MTANKMWLELKTTTI